VPQFVLRHPDDPSVRATYGVDPERGGPWAEVIYNSITVTYDATNLGYDLERPVPGLLAFLCDFDLLGGSDIEDARVWLSLPPDYRRRRPRRGARTVVRIIENLARAAG
jgi:hypothetical protein